MRMQEFQPPNITNEALTKMTETKAYVQEALMGRMLHHSPSDDEALDWIIKYSKNVNFYFVAHPDASLRDIEQIQAYILREEVNTLH